MKWKYLSAYRSPVTYFLNNFTDINKRKQCCNQHLSKGIDKSCKFIVYPIMY